MGLAKFFLIFANKRPFKVRFRLMTFESPFFFLFSLNFISISGAIKFKENKKKKGLSNVINRNLTLKGRLLAKIRKNLARPIQIRTLNAIIAVKGTEFVTEFIQGITNVGTIKGLVSMTSIVNNKSVELKEGTMSSVSIDGAVMPPSEFSGKLMQEFEFAGERMSEEDAAGKKIKL